MEIALSVLGRVLIGMALWGGAAAIARALSRRWPDSPLKRRLYKPIGPSPDGGQRGIDKTDAGLCATSLDELGRRLKSRGIGVRRN